MENQRQKYLLCECSGTKLAIDIRDVAQVYPAFSYAPHFNQKGLCLGVVVAGPNMIPLMNLGRYFGDWKSQVGIDDIFLLCNCNGKKILVKIDKVFKVEDCTVFPFETRDYSSEEVIGRTVVDNTTFLVVSIHDIAELMFSEKNETYQTSDRESDRDDRLAH